jgi:hypothetical protein
VVVIYAFDLFIYFGLSLSVAILCVSLDIGVCKFMIISLKVEKSNLMVELNLKSSYVFLR